MMRYVSICCHDGLYVTLTTALDLSANSEIMMKTVHLLTARPVT